MKTGGSGSGRGSDVVIAAGRAIGKKKFKIFFADANVDLKKNCFEIF